MRTCIKTLGFSLLLLPALTGVVLSPSLYAQEHATQQGEQLRFENFSAGHGLSQTYIPAIIQDRRGFMWFATRAGLLRYDGNQVKIYRHVAGDSSALTDNDISTLYEDRQGILWVGTLNGLNRYDHTRDIFKQYNFDRYDTTKLGYHAIGAIYEDTQGRFWVGTAFPSRWGGLHLMNRQTGIFKRYQHDPEKPNGISSNAIRAIAEDGRGNLWIAHLEDGLDCFDPKRRGEQGDEFKGQQPQAHFLFLFNTSKPKREVFMQLENKSIRHIQHSNEYGRNLKQGANSLARRFFVLTCQLWFILGFTALALSQPGTITTVVGTGTAGFSGDGGLATAAKINSPRDVYIDGAGNIYIADFFNHCVRKVDATSGIITTVAGTGGVAGFSGNGGPATAARLNNPCAMVKDAAGNLYIADQSNQRIRKVDASGIITTFAGTGTVGFSGDGGPATSASLNFPNHMEVDGAGNVYICDQVNDRIRKVDASGTITTFAGTGTAGFFGDGGPATAARFNQPSDVLRDGAGNFYIVDRLNRRVRKIDTGGTITTIAGTGTSGSAGDGGPATSAQLTEPVRVILDGVGNLYISDRTANRIRRVNNSGIITAMAGTGAVGSSGDGGPALLAQFNACNSVGIDASNNLYIVDQNNDRIRKVFADPPIAAAGSDQVICHGESAILGAMPAATGATAPYSFNWTASPLDPSLTSPTDENPTVSPTVTTTYILTVTDANSFVDTDEVTVTVNPNPVANAGSDLATAAGVSAKIGANPTGSGTGPFTYLWSPATGLSSSTAANPTATPSSTTTYEVTVEDANGCFATDQVTVRAGNLVNSRIKAIVGPTNLYDPVLNQVRADIAIKNISGAPIYGPLTAVFKTLTPGPPTITIGNADGGGNGLGCYYDYSNLLGPDNMLSPGETSGIKLWIFQEHVTPAVSFRFFADVIGDLDGAPKVAADDQPLALSFDLQNGVVQDHSVSALADNVAEIASTYALHQNHPNPFNPSTTMQFDLPKAGTVTLKIYNSVGQLVRTLVSGEYEAGAHKISWDARNDNGVQVTSGVYLAVFKAGEVKQVRRVVLMK